MDGPQPVQPTAPTAGARARRVREEAERARAARERRAQEETRLKAASAPGERPGANLPDEGAEDTRTRAQRRVAQLAVILKRHLASQQVASRYGVGSTLLSFTTADLTDLSPTSEFNTNTGDRLNVVDLLRLGAAEFDVTALHDTGGQPRALGRTNRLASFFQRVALYAAQGVCGCPNCASAAIHNDAHHIQAWDHGVPTDLHNLTLVCPPFITPTTMIRAAATGATSTGVLSPGGWADAPPQTSRCASMSPRLRLTPSGPASAGAPSGGGSRLMPEASPAGQ